MTLELRWWLGTVIVRKGWCFVALVVSVVGSTVGAGADNVYLVFLAVNEYLVFGLGGTAFINNTPLCMLKLFNTFNFIDIIFTIWIPIFLKGGLHILIEKCHFY